MGLLQGKLIGIVKEKINEQKKENLKNTLIYSVLIILLLVTIFYIIKQKNNGNKS